MAQSEARRRPDGPGAPADGSSYFSFRELDDPDLQGQSFRLRYEVYHRELGFFDKAPHAGEHGPEERDEYDPHALHVGAIFSSTGEVIGSARLVHPRPLGLPLEEHCTFDETFWKPFGVRRAQDLLHRPGIAEICRLVVSADFRRRANDGRYALNAASSHAPDERRESRPVIALGLFKACFQASRAHGITHWVMAVEPTLTAALDRYAIPFEQIGPIVEFNGPVAPYMASLATLEERMAAEQPALLEDWTSDT